MKLGLIADGIEGLILFMKMLATSDTQKHTFVAKKSEIMNIASS